MKTTDIPSTSARLAAVSPEAMAHYQQMRAKVMPAPGVDAVTCEIVFVMQLAVLGVEIPFKVHAMRAMALGAGKTQLQRLVLAGLGVTLIASQAGRAVAWLDEAHEESQQAAAAG
ncbi:hypothetical protein NWF24_14375 [Variovorax paradoxus]|uniref:hypothetical protein n=1 Tax=Variovorax paradoxus TaxID=34073 RepID=UPI0021AC5068|nr:hypothetical protein [Variovorax paradoxus]UVH60548.1 hypothetical protein NWF24_14375 [Variovorax paradoxus]